MFDDGLDAMQIERLIIKRDIFKSLKKEPLGNNGKKFIIKKINAPSCKEFFEAIQIFIFLKIKKKINDNIIVVPMRPCSDNNSK